MSFGVNDAGGAVVLRLGKQFWFGFIVGSITERLWLLRLSKNAIERKNISLILYPFHLRAVLAQPFWQTPFWQERFCEPTFWAVLEKPFWQDGAVFHRLRRKHHFGL